MYGALQKRPYVSIYNQEQIEVVHGPSCRIDQEINYSRCDDDHIPIIERRNGGGTVVLAPGMLITVIVGNRTKDAMATDYFNAIHNGMIALLQQSRTPAIYRSGISDLSCNNRKILGSSLYLGSRPFYYYYQSSLLINPDITLFERYLHHPPREPDYRAQRSHSEFCTSLKTEGFSCTPEDVQTLFSQDLGSFLV